MKWLRQYFYHILSFLFVFVIVCFGFYSTNQSAVDNQKKSLEQALHRGIIECYAIEGRYPESLDYLVNEYHVFYSQDDFDIDYDIIASNIMPSVKVIEK